MLIQGLRADSAVWRQAGGWTRQDEFAAAQLELTDGWFRVIFSSLGGKVRGEPLRVPRPEDDKPVEKHIETDTATIARWFSMHGGG